MPGEGSVEDRFKTVLAAASARWWRAQEQREKNVMLRAGTRKIVLVVDGLDQVPHHDVFLSHWMLASWCQVPRQLASPGYLLRCHLRFVVCEFCVMSCRRCMFWARPVRILTLTRFASIEVTCFMPWSILDLWNSGCIQVAIEPLTLGQTKVPASNRCVF